MKRVQRPALPSRVAQYLVRQQQKRAEKQSADAPDMEAFWKSRRATRTGPGLESPATSHGAD